MTGGESISLLFIEEFVVLAEDIEEEAEAKVVEEYPKIQIVVNELVNKIKTIHAGRKAVIWGAYLWLVKGISLKSISGNITV